MTRLRLSVLATTFAGVLALGGAAVSAELIHGAWPPARDHLNTTALPNAFKGIEAETHGAIKWKLVPGGQLADGKSTFRAVQDGLMQAGLGVAIYVPNLVPSTNLIYSSIVFSDDVVAATGAAMETITLHCPSCLEEFRKINALPLGGFTGAPYVLMCRAPVRSAADLKGKRVRAAGGSAEMIKLAGGVPIGATLTEAVGLLQRGGMDCMFGAAEWLKTFGYGDFAKDVTDYPLGITGPALGFMMNHNTWDSFTTEQKKIHLKYGAYVSAEMAIGNFVVKNEASLKEVMSTKGVKLVEADAKSFEALIAEFKKGERGRILDAARGFGVKDPEPILVAYDQAFRKWHGLSKGIGRDVAKFAAAMQREIYDKVDPDKL
ncbi:MAG: TRAP transporter substrate-binding protein DctP [Candidatus Eiseniibacteriota bacterium]